MGIQKEQHLAMLLSFVLYSVIKLLLIADSSLSGSKTSDRDAER